MTSYRAAYDEGSGVVEPYKNEHRQYEVGRYGIDARHHRQGEADVELAHSRVGKIDQRRFVLNVQLNDEADKEIAQIGGKRGVYIK